MRRPAAIAAVLCVACFLGRGERRVVSRHWDDDGSGAQRKRLVSLLRGRRRLASAALLLPAIFSGPLPIEAQGMIDFHTMDSNGDGIVDREEYMVSTRDALNADGKANKDARRSIYEFVGQVYQHCDLDGDGVLSEREVEFGQFLVGSEVAAARQAGGQKLPEEESDFGASLALGVLRQLDSNVDGRIDVEEFFDAFRAALTGWSWNEEDFEHPAMQVVMRRMFDKADVRSDGFLNSREVQYAVYLLDQFAVAELVSSIFRDLDLNGNRRIETRELEETLERLRQMRIPMQNSILSIIDEKFSEFDTDGDGALDETETRSLAAEVLHMNQAD